MSFQYTKDVGKPTQLPFKDILFKSVLAGAATAVESPVVPPDEVWEVQQLFLYTNNAGILQLKKRIAPVNYIFEEKDAATWISWSGKIFLKKGQQIVGSCDIAGNLVINIFGVKRLSIESTLASRKLRVDFILPKVVDVQEPRVIPDPEM